jgi:8-oxo-dGTP diphosphatase
MLLTDGSDRLLIVEPTYKPRWELPGGAVEYGESPRAAAMREVLEELGIHREAGALLPRLP